MKKLLVIVDMQNDFVTGVLGTPEANAIVENMCKYIKNVDHDIALTLDTHEDNYLETQEGINLPVSHCIKGTEGHKLDKRIDEALGEKAYHVFKKGGFGSNGLGDFINKKSYEEVTLVGVCTDICVISNAVVIKTFSSETKINVIANLCAGVTPEKHQAALEVMKSIQVNVIE